MVVRDWLRLIISSERFTKAPRRVMMRPQWKHLRVRCRLTMDAHTLARVWHRRWLTIHSPALIVDGGFTLFPLAIIVTSRHMSKVRLDSHFLWPAGGGSPLPVALRCIRLVVYVALVVYGWEPARHLVPRRLMLLRMMLLRMMLLGVEGLCWSPVTWRALSPVAKILIPRVERLRPANF